MSDQLDGDTGEEGAEGQESAVISTLRAKLKDAEAAAKTAKVDAETALVDARSQLERESAAQTLVDAAGYPGLRDTVLSQVVGEILPQGVIDTLKGLQLSVDEDAFKAKLDGSAPPPQAAQATAEALADLQSLGGQVAAAAQGTVEDTYATDIADTNTQEEVEAVAKKYGFLDPN